MCRNSLPDQHRRHEHCRYKNADAQSELHLRCERSTEAGQLLLMDCFFLAASCTGCSIALVLLLVLGLTKIRILRRGRRRGGEGEGERLTRFLAKPGDSDSAFRIFKCCRGRGGLRSLRDAKICSWSLFERRGSATRVDVGTTGSDASPVH